jgi:DNA end-binding protein Ku
LQATGKAGLGKIAFGGREHLVAISVPEDEKMTGLMAYTLRYAEELRDPADYFASIKRVAIDDDQLTLAKQLIQQKSAPFDPDKFKDEYEAALRAMVEAKVKHLPTPKSAPAARSTKVVNLMDALRKSVQGDAPAKVAPAKKAGGNRSKLSLVPSKTRAKATKKRA